MQAAFFHGYGGFSPCWVNAISAGFLALGCLCSSGHPAATADTGTVDARLVSANTSFGLKLLEKLIERKPDENILISPASIAIALEMTYNGARGETQQAMAEALELQAMSLQEVNQSNAALMAKLKNLDDDILLDIANSLWAREGEKFRPDFMKRNQDFYKAYIATLDFADPTAPSVINDWVKEKTSGKIEEIVDKVTHGVIIYLINAVYFKGLWAAKFDKEYTQERDFMLMDGGKKKVPMMMTESKSFRYLMGENFDAVGLPYSDGKLSMYIFVPHRESNLEEFYSNLNAGNWENWMPQFRKQGLIVVMPKFSLGYEVILNNALTDLGMGIAFRASAADFSGICPGGGVWIDEVKHKTYLEVNEEGAEAASATSVKMKRGPRAIYVDRPFFFAIRDNDTGTVLFMGSVVEP
jgi:serine protease inhibitor